MRSSLACAACVAPPFLATREWPPSPDSVEANLSATTPLASLLRGRHRVLGGRSRTSDKIQHSACEAPLSTHRYPRRRTSLFAFPMISTVSCSFCLGWISVRKRLIVNAIALGDPHKDTITLYRIVEIVEFLCLNVKFLLEHFFI